MTDVEFFEASIRANRIISQAKTLLELQLIRYAHLVTGSDKGFNCTYARITRREYDKPTETAKTREQLLAIQSETEWLLQHLETPVEPPIKNPDPGSEGTAS